MAVGFNTGTIVGGLNKATSAINTAAGVAATGVGLAQSAIGSVKAIGNAISGLFGGGGGGGSSGGGGDGQLLGTYSGGNPQIPSRQSPTEWLNSYITQAYSENGVVRYIYQNLFRDLQPDISGYVLLFIAPPVLSGYLDLGNQNYEVTGQSYMTETSKLCPLLATSFSPPVIQINAGSLAGSSGTQHYAQEISITDTMSVSFVDTAKLDIYQYHKSWIQYIFQVTEGTLEPNQKYIDEGRLDYCASFYFVKFMPNLANVQYIGKAVGCFPRELPSTDVLGNRNTNDLTTLTFNYCVSDYREATMQESGHWLYGELSDLIFSQYE